MAASGAANAAASGAANGAANGPAKLNGPCQACGKTGEVSPCARCKEALYCSKECQKKNWKAYKPACATGQPCAIDNALGRLADGTWLHDRPEKDVYRLLIDAYRLRVDEDYTFTGDVDIDSLYG